MKKPSPPKPSSPPVAAPVLHLGTQISVVIGRASADGTRVEQATITGQIPELTEAAWLAAYRDVRARFNEAGKVPAK